MSAFVPVHLGKGREARVDPPGYAFLKRRVVQENPRCNFLHRLKLTDKIDFNSIQSSFAL